MDEVKGVVAIVSDGNGDCLATYADFSNSGYGGFDKHEAQAIRASDIVKRKAVAAFVGPRMAEWLSGYTLDTVWKDMRNNGKCKIILRGVGYDEDQRQEVEKRGDR